MDLSLALNNKDDFLVLFGDNYYGFSIENFIESFKESRNICMTIQNIKDFEKAKRLGVVELDEKRIISFEEKPAHPKTTLISAGAYIFPKESSKLIDKYIKSEKTKENPGYMIKDFVENSIPVEAFVFEDDWFDIGTPEDYEKYNEFLTTKINEKQ